MGLDLSLGLAGQDRIWQDESLSDEERDAKAEENWEKAAKIAKENDVPRARWSYGGFHHFRCQLANQLGLDLGSMWGYGGDKSWDEQLPDDPIRYLLDHSDCEGELTSEECQGLGDRLRELVKDWPDGDNGRSVEGYDRFHAEQLAEICDHVADNPETIVSFH